VNPSPADERPDHPDHPEGLDEAVRLRDERRARWRREGERSIGQNLAMIGALGWTIVTPTLLGIFAGRWLDRYFASGIFWTLGLLVAGLAVGCWVAWKRIYRA
jgi:ATP synthase protein I